MFQCWFIMIGNYPKQKYYIMSKYNKNYAKRATNHSNTIGYCNPIYIKYMQ